MKGKIQRGNMILTLCIGIFIGATMVGGAAAAGIMAERSTHPIYVDGQPTEMEAYNIGGHNYVKLWDIGQAVGFNVYWQDGVQVDSTSDYTGEPPALIDTPVAQEREDTQNVDAIKQEIVDRTNAIRKEQGVALLVVSEKLTQAAQIRAEEMAATGIYSHTRPDGRVFYTVTNCSHAAENIHRVADWQLTNTDLADTLVSAWEKSETHRKNMINGGLSEVGVGLARGVNASGDSCWYCVQFFLYDGQVVTQVDCMATSK